MPLPARPALTVMVASRLVPRLTCSVVSAAFTSASVPSIAKLVAVPLVGLP